MKITSNTIWLLLLFLFALNAFNMESRIILGIFVLVVLIECNGRVWITRTSVLLFFFSLSFYLLAAMYNPTMMTYYILPFLLAPFMGYIVGYSVMNSPKNVDQTSAPKRLKMLIYAIVFGRFTHGLLNFISSNGYQGYIRNGMDVWTKTIIAATGQGALMTMSISLLFYALFVVKNENILEKEVLLAAVVLSLLNSLFSASRTALLIMLSVFAICALYTLTIKEIQKSTKRNILLGLLVVVICACIVYQQNLFGIRTAWEASPLFERINTASSYEAGDENRAKMYKDAVTIGLNHPFGDGNMNRTAHNLWLDIFRQTGWLPFVLLIIFTIISLRYARCIIRSEIITMEIKYLVLSLMIGMMFNFFVEPIMKGMPYYFVAFCIITGAMESTTQSLAYCGERH